MNYITLKKAGYAPIAFIDNDEKRHGGTYMGLPVLPLSAVAEQEGGCCVVISVSREYERIYNQCARQMSRLYVWVNIYGRELLAPIGHQYFDFFPAPANEAESIGLFLDGGCYDMATSFDFAEWSGGYYTGIIAFEPDSRNYQTCQEALAERGLDRTTLLNKGLWKDDAKTSFSPNGVASRIVDKNKCFRTVWGGYDIDVTSIDKVCGELPSTEKVGFIKMDIEGAELPALQGARETIIKWKPKLAISAYHRKEDFIEIPLYILSIREDYQFALRHYYNCAMETVLYAW
jgi:FkbM family methyltransferase